MSWYRNEYNEVRGQIIAAVIALAAVLFIAVLVIVINWSSAKTCSDYGNNLQLETKYNAWAGCFVKWEGRWIDSDDLDINDVIIHNSEK